MEGGNEPLRPGINRTDPERQDEGPEPSPWLTETALSTGTRTLKPSEGPLRPNLSPRFPNHSSSKLL